MDTIIRAIVGYFVLLLVVRVLRRRAGSQMTMFEFVLIFLIGGVIILSTVDRDRSVTNCTCAVITVGVATAAPPKMRTTMPSVPPTRTRTANLYGLSGLLLAATLFPFAHGIFGSRGLGISFAIIFFIASSAASAAYLTVSEIFPLELRAFAIAIFYSLGTLIAA
jgi:hypothetical protein